MAIRPLNEIETQVSILNQFFPGIGAASGKIAKNSLPDGAEAWLAIPKWQSVAPSYNRAINTLFGLMAKRFGKNFYDWTEGKHREPHLRENYFSAKALKALNSQQNDYKILVIAAQSGMRHINRSVNDVYKIVDDSEFGLGVFEVGCMLLANPGLFERTAVDLCVDCPGSEYSPGADTQFMFTPCFYFSGGRVKLDIAYSDHSHPRHGSATGFLPDALPKT